MAAPYSNLSEAVQAAAPTQDISAHLLNLLKDPKLLHSAGLIGGKWTTLTKTYEVRNVCQHAQCS